MQTKGSILFLVRDLKGLEGLRQELTAAGFYVHATDEAKQLLHVSCQNAFQYLIVSLDAVDEKFIQLLPRIEVFLGAVSTLFSEFPQSSAGRLLKLQHPSKVYGLLNAKLIEQNYYQGRVRALKSRAAQSISTPIRWDGLNVYNPKSAEQIFSGSVKDVPGDAWKECGYLTVLPILQQGEGGYMMVGVNQANKGHLTKQILTNWLQSIQDTPLIPLGISMELRADEISVGGIVLNPFFAVKGNKELVYGLGMAPQTQTPPQPVRLEEGFLAFAIDSLKSGMVVEFDIYVHLPQNDKFIKLVKAGTTLNPEYHKHLFGSAKEFHVKETEKLEMQSYFAKKSLQHVFSGKKAA